MPHTSRKRQHQHRKRYEETLEDGWTRVVFIDDESIRGRSCLHETVIPPQDPDLTVYKLKSDFDHFSKLWRESACKRRMDGFVARAIGISAGDRQHIDDPNRSREIQQTDERKRVLRTGVLIALGSVSRLQMRRRSLWQLVCFMDVVRTRKCPYFP